MLFHVAIVLGLYEMIRPQWVAHSVIGFGLAASLVSKLQQQRHNNTSKNINNVINIININNLEITINIKININNIKINININNMHKKHQHHYHLHFFW